MKLADHVNHIRQLIDNAFRNRLGRMGISEDGLTDIENIPQEYLHERNRIEKILNTFIDETKSNEKGYEKLVEELTFTLFNRIAALKVMEAHTLHPEIITKREQHGGRSFSHSLWLEQHPEARNKENEGLLLFFEDQLRLLSHEIPLFRTDHPFHLLPTAIELNNIIDAFNQVENDPDIKSDIWKSDDILGWLYESYNNYKKAEHKASGQKTEYNKVSIQSQVYTPRWVVQFLVDNSLGKLYLEMYPNSQIKEKYKIANAPQEQIRKPKPLHEIKIIDPAVGSGNFLLYAFDLLYDLYLDQIENYGADYDEDDIPTLIIENNLHGIDLDDRAVQLAQFGLYIKAKRRKRNIKINRFNIVSSDFYLPGYEEVKHLFENGEKLSSQLKNLVIELWDDLQKAHKFGSLIRLREKFRSQLKELIEEQLGTNTNLDSDQNLQHYRQFRKNFFNNLEKAVTNNITRQGQNFLNTKTADAITFLKLLTQKYDVAVANPPYTDSSDYGPELKKFIEANYKKPHKFHSNLYAAFIKRNIELTTEDGYIGMIHPHTFMFIKSFEDVRKYMIEQTHIALMVDYGLDRVNLFGPGILLDATWYVLGKKQNNAPGIYFQITGNQQEKTKKSSLEEAYSAVMGNRPHPRVYYLHQEKLKMIDGWPFIYWISDAFREKFRAEAIKDILKVVSGIKTGNNRAVLRFWWELGVTNNNTKWVKYTKGGPFNKWYGNIWLLITIENNFEKIKSQKSYNIPSLEHLFNAGITYNGSGSKGVSFRLLSSEELFDMGASAVIISDCNQELFSLLSLLNSKLTLYITDCLNPTVNKQPNDIERIPFVQPNENIEKILAILAKENVYIKKQLCTYSIIEINFEHSPLTAFEGNTLKDRALAYLNYENFQLTRVLINEAIIDELIYQVYELSPEDREQVEQKMGKSIGALPVFPGALEEFKKKIIEENAETKDIVLKHLNSLETTKFDDELIRTITEEFESLYQSNNNLEEFCKRHQVNPINVWYWFKGANILPKERAKDIALEFLADTIRTLLQEDEDGIIPLVSLPGEDALLQRLEYYCIQNGFTQAQFVQLDSLLRRPLNKYLENHFFKDLSDHLNLFMYLPKTPFIWHLSSGKYQGLELYILIYKWNRDSLFKIKSQYIHDRKNSLEYRLMQLQDANTAQAQNEKELIRFQLQEIEEFAKKIDELIAEGYDPKLDDGVGKNIAPLQKKGLLRAEVLKTTGKKSELEKYLNADW